MFINNLVVFAEHDDLWFPELGLVHRRLGEAHDCQAVTRFAKEGGGSVENDLAGTALAGLEKEPFLLGLFWWKWIPGRPAHDPDFKMEDADARDLLTRYWAAVPGG